MRVSASAKVRIKKVLLCSLLIAAGVIVVSLNGGFAPKEVDLSKITPQEIAFTFFREEALAGRVESVEYSPSAPQFKGRFTDGTPFITDNPETEDFKSFLLEQNIAVTTLARPVFLLGLLQMLIVGGVFLFVLNNMLTKIISANNRGLNTDLELNMVYNSNVTFDAVAGNEEAKEEMLELVDFLIQPDKFRQYGAVTPKGTIVYGPPGTGKTLLVKALAGTANVPFIAIAGSDFVEKYVGVGAARVRQVFKLARANRPCIIFIDEIDAVGKTRSEGGFGSHDERDQTLNQLLSEMDGFNASEGIIVIAATNRLDVLDPALLRAGRFDRQIRVGLPDLEARHAILQIHGSNKPLDPAVNLKDIARQTIFMSGADLANVMNEASISAAKAGNEFILREDIERAIHKVTAGTEKKNRSNIGQIDRETTAFHEAGHALVAKLLGNKSVPKVTIIPTSKGAGGYTIVVPEEKMHLTKRDILTDIAVSLGGRAAEELIFGDDNITTGASQDLRKATRLAIKMVKSYGMSKNIGLVSLPELESSNLAGSGSKVLGEVRSIIEQTYQKTCTLLRVNQNILRSLADMLLEQETVHEKELEMIIKSCFGDNDWPDNAGRPPSGDDAAPSRPRGQQRLALPLPAQSIH